MTKRGFKQFSRESVYGICLVDATQGNVVGTRSRAQSVATALSTTDDTIKCARNNTLMR